MALVILIVGLLLFVGLVVLHELGHAIVARRQGVDVEEFGIGFPPRIWSKKLKNGTLFSINLLPLGGFVRLKGEHDSATGAGTYGGSSLWSKTKILLAGVVVNWLTAVVIFTFLALIGMPQVVSNQFTVDSDTTYSRRDIMAVEVVKGSPADKAGLQQNDMLLSINGQQITSAQHVSELTQANAGKTIELKIQRNGQQKDLRVSLYKERKASSGYAGIGPGEQTLRQSTWSAPIVGLGVTAQFSWLTLEGLGKTIVQLGQSQFAEASQNIAGPVGIFAILQQSSEVGIIPVLFLIGIISLTLAIMNVLPIPALDGGRLFVTLIFRALKKPLTKEREESIQAAGFMTLMILVVLITIVDVGRIGK